MAGKDAQLPDSLADLVVAILADEEPPQAFRRDVDLDVIQVDAGPGLFQGCFVEVGGQDLDRRRSGSAVEELEQGDGQRIGFLAGRATGHPDPEHGPRRPAGHQGREHLLLQRLERLRVAEELRDADQEILVQVLDLGGIILEDREVVPGSCRFRRAMRRRMRRRIVDCL